MRRLSARFGSWDEGLKVRRRQVEPLATAIRNGRKPKPFQDRGFVSTELEGQGRRRLVHEMDATDIAFALDEETPDAMTRNAVEVVLAPFERKADQFDELFRTIGEVLAEAEQAQAMLAKGIDPDPDGFSVRPEYAIPFEVRVFGLSIPGRIATKQEG